MNLFQIISALLVLIVLILLVRYAWGIFFDKNYYPVEWENAVKTGKVSKDLVRLERNYPDKVRFYNWWFQVERLKRENVPGDFAELGVYKGESAKILHRMDPSRKFHLYDTFEGFREEDLKGETGEAATYTTRNFADTSLEAARRNIGGNENIVFHPGRFQELDSWTVGQLDNLMVGQAETIEAPSVNQVQIIADHPNAQLSNCPTVQLSNCPTAQLHFALVNIDVDLYNPTKAGLEYFYPLLSPGGVIIVHDYNHKWPGIKKAADEFAATIPESLVTVPDMEGSVMIVKSSTASV